MFGLAQLSDLMRVLVAAAADRQDLDDVVLQEPVHQSVLRSTDPDRPAALEVSAEWLPLGRVALESA